MTIYEITKLMGNNSSIQKDIMYACNTVRKLFEEKYINVLNETVISHQKLVEKNKPKEVGLLNALKPFVDQKYHPQIDRYMGVVMMLSTANNINSELRTAYKQQLQDNDTIYTMSMNSIHEDGIYDIDNKCLLQKKLVSQQENLYNMTNILLMLSLMGSM